MPATLHTHSVAVRLDEWAKRFDQRLSELVFPPERPASQLTGSGVEWGDPTSRLRQAVRYAVLAPGKRLRPYLVCRSHALCGGQEEDAFGIAAAAECVHAFSLVHDDLPAMDDDDLRRGRPSAHVQFGEATAILAGDALLALAFELIAEQAPDAARARSMTLELARAVGLGGMIGGQAADMEGEGRRPDRLLVAFIHRHKTARLFGCCCRLGAWLADSDRQSLDALGAYGRELGLAFQIVDDLLDATSSAERLGKSTGKDAPAGKQTLGRCVGIEESRRAAAAHVERAVASLGRFGDEAGDLGELARFVLARDS